MTANRAGIIPHPVTGALVPSGLGPGPEPGRRRTQDITMTGRFDPCAIPDPALAGTGPQVAPGSADELPGGQCTRCGAVGTHYLTCPVLRLPSGFRLS